MFFCDVHALGTTHAASSGVTHASLRCPGLEAKYGGLQATSRDQQLQQASEASGGNDAAQHTESNDSNTTAVNSIKGEEPSGEVSSCTCDGGEMSGGTDLDTLPAASDSEETGQDIAESGGMDGSESMVLGTGKPCNRASSADSTAAALAAEELIKDEQEWATCLKACKGRLNRLFLDCGMPSLPCQVRREVCQLVHAMLFPSCINFTWHILWPAAAE